MLNDAFCFIRQMYIKRTNLTCIIISLFVLLIDCMTGKNIEFPIVYALPVGMAAWQNRKRTAYVTALLLPLVRLGFHFPWHETQSLFVSMLNTPITVIALMFYAYLVDQIARQTRELEKEVKILKGILPICASCKKIRNEKGDYEQIEKYVTEHSEALFSHGICPECARKLYPEFFNDTEE